MITDPIADLLVRLKNAQVAGKAKVVLPHSNIKATILDILKKEDVLSAVSEKLVHGKKVLEVTFKPSEQKRIFPELVRVSTPGRRWYVKSKDIPRPLRGYGLVVLTTPQGVMTGKDARRKGVGGEILFWEK